jgi:hypothetical protein
VEYDGLNESHIDKLLKNPANAVDDAYGLLISDQIKNIASADQYTPEILRAIGLEVIKIGFPNLAIQDHPELLKKIGAAYINRLNHPESKLEDLGFLLAVTAKNMDETAASNTLENLDSSQQEVNDDFEEDEDNSAELKPYIETYQKPFVKYFRENFDYPQGYIWNFTLSILGKALNNIDPVSHNFPISLCQQDYELIARGNWITAELNKYKSPPVLEADEKELKSKKGST